MTTLNRPEAASQGNDNMSGLRKKITTQKSDTRAGWDGYGTDAKISRFDEKEERRVTPCAGLHLILPKIFRFHVFDNRFQFILALKKFRRKEAQMLGCFDDGFSNKDGGFDSDGQRDRVTGPAVDHHLSPIDVEVKVRKKSVVLEIMDDDPRQRGVEGIEDLLHQIMRHGTEGHCIFQPS